MAGAGAEVEGEDADRGEDREHGRDAGHQRPAAAVHHAGGLLGGDRGRRYLVDDVPFALRLLAPACVLHALRVDTPGKIAALCGLPPRAAGLRDQRMALLNERDAFFSHPLERQVIAQFQPFIRREASGLAPVPVSPPVPPAPPVPERPALPLPDRAVSPASPAPPKKRRCVWLVPVMLALAALLCAYWFSPLR